MASFYAELQVAGSAYPVRYCVYEFTQATSERGRVVAKVRHSLVRLTLDVPNDDKLLDWAHAPYKPLAGRVIFYDAKGGPALETLFWEEGQCVGYQEEFFSGDQNQGAYVCHLTIAAPKLTLQPGGPAAYVGPPPGEHGTPQALTDPFMIPLLTPATKLEQLVLPTAGELAATAAKALAEAALAAAAAAALPVLLTVGLILGSSTPAGGPGIDQHLPPPLSRDALRLIELEEERKRRSLTGDEEAELFVLLAKVRGVHVAGPQDLAYRYSQDIAFNQWWDQHAPPDLRQLDINATLDHVEYRDFSVPRANGIGGAHNAFEWAKHRADYVETSRTPHPTVPGVAQVEYKIQALDRALKPTGVLKADVYEKTVYDPTIWPRPRLERAFKEALLDAHSKNAGALPTGWWEGTTQEGDTITGTYRAGKIGTFFFK
jgi:hypothetical protein